MNYRYFTTPIYYANGYPHAGHLYTTILASTLKLHYQQRGMKVKFLTGLDEHGEAVKNEAKKRKEAPKEFVDDMAMIWQDEFERFEIEFKTDDSIFQRTTDENHKENVRNILNYCFDKGDIYLGVHEGFYCVKCESFLTRGERNEQNHCLIHKISAELRKEQNYFFRTSKYSEELKQKISNNEIIKSERYKNELLAMLDDLEGDLSISRPKSRLTWGIELPFDSNHVTYVWFDALPNYLTGIGGFKKIKAEKENESDVYQYWKNVHHILGKDILKFHGIFWPAICLSLGLPLPKLLVTGWLLKEGHKMSKSLGKVLTPQEILHYGRDMFVNYVFRVTNPGEDINITWEPYFECYNSELAYGVGNLLARTIGMVKKYCERKIPNFNWTNSHVRNIENMIIPLIENKEVVTTELIVQEAYQAISKVKKAFDNDFRLAEALIEVSRLIVPINKYITNLKPWELAAQKEFKALHHILALSVAVLCVVSYLLYPFFPKKMAELLRSIGMQEEKNIFELKFFDKAENFVDFQREFFNIKHGFIIPTVPKLYPRIEIEYELKAIELLFNF